MTHIFGQFLGSWGVGKLGFWFVFKHVFDMVFGINMLFLCLLGKRVFVFVFPSI